jgi:hypothetical protein
MAIFQLLAVYLLNPKWIGYSGVRHGPGEVKLDLTLWTIARDQRGLHTKILVHEGCCVYDVSPRYRVCWFRELAQIGAVPTVHLERAREAARLSPATPRTCHSPGLNPIGKMTGDAPDYRSPPGWTLPALRWYLIALKPSRKGGGQHGGAASRLLMKICQKVRQNVIFWWHVRASKIFGIRFCRNRYFFLKYFISFPVIWGQSQRGQLWPHPVQLG